MELPPEQAKSHNYRSEQNYQKQIRPTLVRVKRSMPFEGPMWRYCHYKEKQEIETRRKQLDGELLLYVYGNDKNTMHLLKNGGQEINIVGGDEGSSA